MESPLLKRTLQKYYCPVITFFNQLLSQKICSIRFYEIQVQFKQILNILTFQEQQARDQNLVIIDRLVNNIRMLFTAQKPLQIDFLPAKKVIIMTKQRILFSFLDFVEEFMDVKLICQNPTQMVYCPENNETLIVSQQSIEVHYFDWVSSKELRLYVSLNCQEINSIRNYEGTWELYGKLYQYSPKNMKFFSVNAIYDGDLPNCFCQNYQFFIHGAILTAYDHKSHQKHNIQWNQGLQILSHIHRKKQRMKLKAKKCSSTSYKYVLVINDEHCLIISDEWKAYYLLRKYVICIGDNLIITLNDKNKLQLDQINNGQINDLKTISTYNGEFIAGCIVQNRIYMIVYDLKEIRVKTVDLELKLDCKTDQIKEKEIQQVSLFNSNEFSLASSLAGSKSTIQQALKASISKFQAELQNSFGFNEATQMQIKPPSNSTPKFDSKSTQPNLQKLFPPPNLHNNLSNKKFKGKENDDDQNLLAEEASDFYDGDLIRLSSSNVRNELSNSNDALETPKFDELAENSGILSAKFGDRWDNYNKNWSNFDEPNFSDLPSIAYAHHGKSPLDVDQSVISQPFQQFELIQSQKVKAFLPDNQPVTHQIIQQINRKKYTQLMSELYKKERHKFDDYLYKFINQIIKEDEAMIFFAEHIRVHNPQFTRDSILRLYMCLQNNQKNKLALTKALSEFKLIQVPKICLPFHQDIINIYAAIYPQVYLGDLLAPNINLIKNMLDSYFVIENFQMQIKIEDQLIDITHPRNVLNVLLYLNEFYQLSIEKIFDVYCSKMIKNGYADIIKRLVQEEGVFDICGVQKYILEDIVEVSVKKLLAEQSEQIGYVQDVISILNSRKKTQMLTIVHLVSFFNSKQLHYTMESLFMIYEKKSAFCFAEQLISDNPATKLANIKIAKLFKLLWFIQEEEDLKIYNKQLLKLIQNLIEKYQECLMINQIFEVLAPISYVVKRGYIAQVLYRALDGKFMNRLANKQIQYKTFYELFPELFMIENLKMDLLPRDRLTQPADSKYFTCSWTQYEFIFQKYFITSIPEVKYILYKDVDLAIELSQYGVIYSENLKNTLKDLQKFRIQPEQKIVFKNSLRLDSSLRVALIQESQNHRLQSQGSKQSQNFQKQNKAENKLLMRSMNNIKTDRQLFVPEYPKKMARSHDNISLEQKEQKEEVDPILINLRLEVHEDQILASLKSIYQSFNREKLMKAMGIIDREKVHLYHYDTYRYLKSLSLSYQFEIVLPFEFLLLENKEESLPLTLQRVKMQVNLQNFWIIYMLIEVVYGLGVQVFKILLQKIIVNEQIDDLFEVVGMLSGHLKVQKNFMAEMMKKCKQNKLTKTLSVLENGLILI